MVFEAPNFGGASTVYGRIADGDIGATAAPKMTGGPVLFSKKRFGAGRRILLCQIVEHQDPIEHFTRSGWNESAGALVLEDSNFFGLTCSRIEPPGMDFRTFDGARIH